MATLKDAEQARVEMADQLQAYGAHAISVHELDPEEAATEGAEGAKTAEGAEGAEGAEDTMDAEDAEGASRPSRSRRRPSYEVVAWFDDEPPDTLPAEIEVRRGSRKVMVPVRVRREERFQIE